MHGNVLLCVLGACVVSLLRPFLVGCSISVLVPVSEVIVAVLANCLLHPFFFLFFFVFSPSLSLQKVSLLLPCDSLGAHSKRKAWIQ